MCATQAEKNSDEESRDKRARSFYRPELDVLRFIAFLMVFLHHSVPPRRASVRQFADVGGWGVCVFFVLSSFLITELLRKEKERTGTVAIRAFYVRRVLRIWPLQYFFLIFAYILGCYVPAFYAPGAAIASMMLFVGNWYTARHGYIAGVASALWSISLEEQFYLLWPMLCRTFEKRIILMISLLLMPVAALAIVYLMGHGSSVNPGVWTNPFVQFQMFGYGAVLSLRLNGRTPFSGAGARSAALVGGMALFLIATLVFHAMQEGATTTGIVCGYFCSAAASCLLLLGILGARIPPWMSPAVYLGKISYGLYVFHVLCLDLTNRWMGVAGQPAYLLLKILVALGSTGVLAALSYRFIESPFIRLKERFAIIQSRSV